MNGEAEQYLIYLQERNEKFEECAANIQLAIGERPEDGRYSEALHNQVGAAAFSAYAMSYDGGLGLLYAEYRRGHLDSYRLHTSSAPELEAISAGNLVEQYRACGASDGYRRGLSLLSDDERSALLKRSDEPN